MCTLHLPNVVLFKGVIGRPREARIVTEYLPRGSLFKILHKAESEHVDFKQRIMMAMDVARGMHYLHTCSP